MNNDLKNFLSIKIAKLKLTTNDIPDLLKLASKKFTTPAVDILKIMADCFYEQHEYNNCLVTLEFYAQELNLTTKELGVILLERYAKEIELSKKNYEHNIELLKNYQWCWQKEFPSFDELDKILLFQDQQIQTYFERQSCAIEVVEKDSIVPQEREKIYLLCEINNLENLCYLEKILSKGNSLVATSAKNPLYSYYENFVLWTLILMQGQLDHLLSEERVVIFLSWQEIEEFFKDCYVIKLNIVLSGKDKIASKSRITDDLGTFFSKKETKAKHLWIINKEYYEEHNEEILQNIRSKKPRILFITSRFTTALQYHVRDCMMVCQSLGCETRLIIEPSDIHNIFSWSIIKEVHDFKPDIFFIINYFIDRNYIPQQIIGVNWIQDPMPHLTDLKTPLTLSNNDYILALHPESVIDTGYLKKQIMRAEIPANHLIYQPYKLSDQERNLYSADIILVANSNDLAEKNLALINILNDAKQSKISNEVIEKFLRQYYQLVYEEKINLTTPEATKEYLTQEIKAHCNMTLEEEVLQKTAEEFFSYTKATVFRNVLAEWLIDGGYTNLKLYGNDWGNNPKFAPYAMGVAPNGEILSKIYQSAKVLLGTNVHMTSTARSVECFLSGGFYMSNYIEPKYDCVDIRMKYAENEEIPLFYNRQDLYAKLDYYLENPEERSKITERTRAKMLVNDTYEALMKKMLNWLAEKV